MRKFTSVCQAVVPNLILINMLKKPRKIEKTATHYIVQPTRLTEFNYRQNNFYFKKYCG